MHNLTFATMTDHTPNNALKPNKSLDPDDKDPMFYFIASSSDSKKTKMFSLKQQSVKKMIPFFSVMVSNDCSDTPDAPNKAIHVDLIKVQDECAHNAVYWINTIEHYELISKYIKYWENKLDKENYISPGPQTGYIHQILLKFDLDLINEYVNRQLFGKKFKSQAIRKFASITALNPLLKCVDGFLQMEGISRKIYSYIAEIIRTCSIIDISDRYLLDHFKSLQLSSLEQWRKDNPELIHEDLETTGSLQQ